MDVPNLLKKLERVKAPPDFEQKILAQLSLRKRRKLRIKYLRLSLAGAFSAALVFFMAVNVFILPKKGPLEVADLEKGLASPSTFQRGGEPRNGETIPIIEAADYAGEIQSASREPQTIYILEQVSEGTSTKIKY
ncbi:MAG: hypothetical protein E3I52_03320 [Candidatus Aminicenantes bacterium]|nr:MAG: hypothetical protein E3I52_03320 [Candidatus Aminicenantes bacterium]